MAEVPEFDADAFNAFEKAGWRNLGPSYHGVTRDSTASAAAPLLAAVNVKTGNRLLDIACGPGYAAGLAAERGAEAIGVDASPSMLEVARQSYPKAHFQAGDAEALEFADASFDAAVCAFGILHFGRPEAAIGEAHRVLRPGARYAFTSWLTPDRVETFGIFRQAVEAHGSFDVALPEGPPMFRFADATAATEVLQAAGFEEVATEEIEIVRRITPEGLLAALTGATVRSRALVEAQRPEAKAAIEAAILETARNRAVDGIVTLNMPARMTSGRRPG